MKRLNELKLKRSENVEAMLAITQKAEAEKRFKTEEELNKWNELKALVEQLDAEVQNAETEERFNLSFVSNQVQKEVETKEVKELKRYDLSKAIRETKSGRGLTGFEAEIQQEGEREYKGFGVSAQGIIVPEKVLRSFAKSSNTGHHSEMQAGVDIIADRGILSKLGVTTYEGLTSQMKLVFGNGFNASFVDETVAAVQNTNTEANGKIEPKRIQGWDLFSNEFLAQSATMGQLMADMLMSIEAATAQKILNDILALPALTGFDSAAVAAALTWKNVMKLKGAVKSTQFVSPKFVAGGELYASMESTAKESGAARYIIEEGKVSGYEAVDAQGLIASGAKNSLIFGDFSKAYVGYFGGVEILVDPYTASNTGQTKLTYHRLGDVAVNPNAFKSIQNASL